MIFDIFIIYIHKYKSSLDVLVSLSFASIYRMGIKFKTSFPLIKRDSNKNISENAITTINYLITNLYSEIFFSLI